jgi:hypothetical protein
MKRYEKRENIIEIKNATSSFKSVKANAPHPLPSPLSLVMEVKLCCIM